MAHLDDDQLLELALGASGGDLPAARAHLDGCAPIYDTQASAAARG
jgi:hypothetical protein